jgi:hypothetical protein
MYEEAEPWAEPFSPIELSEGLGPVIDTRLAA